RRARGWEVALAPEDGRLRAEQIVAELRLADRREQRPDERELRARITLARVEQDPERAGGRTVAGPLADDPLEVAVRALHLAALDPDQGRVEPGADRTPREGLARRERVEEHERLLGA